MKRFALGFLCGAAAMGLIAAAVGQLEANHGESSVEASPSATSPDTATRSPARRRHAATVSEDQFRGATPSGVVPPTPPPSGTAPTDPFQLVRDFLEAGDLESAGTQLQAVLRNHPLDHVPRAIVEQLAVQPPPGGTSQAWNAAAGALQTWTAEEIVAALDEISREPRGTHALAALTRSLADRLAGLGHAELEITRRLATSPDAGQRVSGLHLAARARPIQYDLLAEAARHDDQPEVRYAGYAHLINHAVGKEDAVARRLAGTIAVEVFEGRGPTELRPSAARALAFGGGRGLDIAQELVTEGGLDEDTELALITESIARGRLRSLLERATGDRQFLMRVSQAVFDVSEPRPADVMALWPYVPQIIDSPHEEWTLYIGEALVWIERPDLAVELVLDRSLSTQSRTNALYSLLEHAGDPQRALVLARKLLEDPGETVALRKGIVNTVWDVSGSEDVTVLESASALARDVAERDSNEWVRNDATDLARSLTRKLAALKAKE